VVGTVCNSVSGAASSVAGAGVSAVFSDAARWVASGAVWLIAQVGRAMSATTSIDLGAGWFSAHEAVMASLSAVVVLPMTCCAAIQAVYRQSASMLLRTFLVHLPLSLLLTGVAVTLVRMALAVTDAMSATVLSSAGVDSTNLLSGLFTFLAPATLAAGPVPGFAVFIGGLLVALAALVLWLELVVRAAAVSVAVLFLPLALAALVWPSVAHWCRRLADTIVALVLSKLVVAAVLSLSAGAIAGGLGVSGAVSSGGFASVVTGIALLVIATLSPFMLLRLVPAVEAGAVAHLESTRHRLKSAAVTPVRGGGNLALDLARRCGSNPDGDEVGSIGATGADTSAIPMIAGTALGPEVAMSAGAAGAASGMGGESAGAGAGGGTATRAAGPGVSAASASATGSGPSAAVPDGDGGAGHAPPVRDTGTGRGADPSQGRGDAPGARGKGRE
jgi:hypothetical protein